MNININILLLLVYLINSARIYVKDKGGIFMLGKSINKHGFTLIEIIVVIVILAVLMAVAVPSVMSYINEGQKTKYETVARAALINTQVGVAEDIADDGKANDALGVAKWVEALDKDRFKVNYDLYGSRKNYGDNVNKIFVNEIFLTGSDSSSDRDVKSITLYIQLKGTKGYRKVDVKVNGKMTVADSNVSGVPAPGTAVHYNTSAK